jgi:hypothetical protein
VLLEEETFLQTQAEWNYFEASITRLHRRPISTAAVTYCIFFRKSSYVVGKVPFHLRRSLDAEI